MAVFVAKLGDGTIEIEGPEGFGPVRKVIFAGSIPEYWEMDRRETFSTTPDLNGLSAYSIS